jgi:positive regulator of sigma E activity
VIAARGDATPSAEAAAPSFRPTHLAAPPLRARAPCLSVAATVVGSERCGFVEVEVVRSQGCKSCSGLCLWRRLPDRGRERYRAEGAFEVGDAVALSLPARSLLRGSLLLYGLPLAALLAGGGAGQWLLGSDAGCLLGALSGVALMLAAAPGLARRIDEATLDELRVERAALAEARVERTAAP